MEELIITVAQTRRFENPQDGIKWLKSHLNGTTDLLILPENWIGIKILSNEEFNEYVDELSKVAREINGVVIGGAAYVMMSNTAKSICPMVSPDGLVNYSEKIFPSKATGERLRINGGNKLGIINLKDWLIGCVICIDAVYPEVTRTLAKYGAHVIMNPSSISADRINFWRSLGLVRAFENSAYYVASLGTNYKYLDGRDVLGGSFIADPNGGYPFLAPLGTEGVWKIELRIDDVNYARSRRGYTDDLSSIMNIKIDVQVAKIKF